MPSFQFMRQFSTRLAGLLSVIFLALTLAAPAHAQSYVFTSFDVQGNVGLDDAAVIGFSGLTTGTGYSASDVEAAYQRLQDTGLFETLELIPSGNRLVIRVTEYPLVNRISVEGNRVLQDKDALELIGTAPRRVFNPAQVETDVEALIGAYRDLGRYDTTVTPRIIRRDFNRVDVVFEVTESRVVEIERVSFVGNRAYSDRRLRRVLESKQAGPLRALIRRDTLIEDQIELDKALLRDFYLSRGYPDIEVQSVTTEFSRERNAFFMTVNLLEGQKFTFGNITVVSEIPGVEAADFERLARIRTGRAYNPVLIDNVISRMEDEALKKGLNLLRVDPRVTRNERDLSLDIEFALVEGPRIFVERIEIEGNATTLDRVIRRQFRIAEGDVFNPREIREAAARIRALGLFETSDISTRPGTADDRVFVDVEVQEALTGSFNFGAAFSLSSGFGVTANFRERNFLGRGQTLNFDFNLGLDNAEGGFTFVEPAFLGRDLQFSFDAEYRQTEYDYTDYDTQTWLVRPAFDFPLNDRSRLALRYTYAGDRIFNVSANSSSILQNEESAGRQTSSGLGYTWVYDTRRTGLNPNAGVLFEFGQEFAGVGGDVTFSKTTAKAIAQTKVLNEEVTLRATLEGGALKSFGQNSRLNDRFFLTTSRMRGFAPAGVGPRDLTVANRDAVGGNFFAVARVEAEFPLGLPEEYGITGGVFAGIGSVWGLDDTGGGAVDDSFHLRATYGLSLFWTTPIGPLRFNFSNVLKKQPYDDAQSFDLTIQTRF